MAIYDVLANMPRPDFSGLGKIMPAYEAGLENFRQDQIRQAFQGGLPRGPGGAIDFNRAADIAARAGGLNQIAPFAGLANAQATQAHANAVLAETAAHNRATESLGRAALEEKPQYMKWTDPDSHEMIVKLNPLGTGAEIVRPAGAPLAPTSPYAPTRKMSGEEAKDTGFSDRMVNSHMILRGLEGLNNDWPGYLAGLATNAAKIGDNPLVNTFLSADRQRFMQASRDFINAQLRRESGAAINQGEFENAYRQYLPRPGDKPEVIEQKRRNRELATEAMFAGAGRGYKPPGGYIGSKGPALAPTEPAATVTAPAAATPADKIPEEHKTRLRANPKEAEMFDQRYGVGSAARVLGVTR